jgi:leucyl aminopeptidase
MNITVSNAPAAELETEALILAIPEKAEKPSPWEAVDAAVGGLISAALAGPGFTGKRNQTLAISTPGAKARELVLVGLGEADDTDLEVWRQAVASGVNEARERGNRRLAVPLPEIGDLEAGELAAAATEAAVLANYRFQAYKPVPPDRVSVESMQVATPADVGEQVARAGTVADAACWARDLINTPSNDKRADALADIALEMASEYGLGSELIDHEEAAEIGLNGLLAVGMGSEIPPRLVLLEHRPAGADGPPVVLVGKGITFDTGGISLKPARGMADMKGDMSGAAAVYATMRALAELAAPRWVIGVTPLAENMPGSRAYRPSDIIRAYDGTTIEVLNTDAEGRVVLADALAYSRKRYQPRCIVDLATLTGACVVALGSAAAGLMSNDEDLCGQLQEAGEATGERLWRLPAWPIYDKMIDSEVANVRNSAGRDAGVVTAGMFLKRFVGETPWAHLDIAGTALLQKATPYQPKGGTGFGVRLLSRWLGA